MSLRSSRERDGSTGLVPGNPSEPERGTAELTRCGWGGAGCPPKHPLSLPFLLSHLQHITAFYLFLCLAPSASPFLSSPSSLSSTCFLFFFSFGACFPSALLQKLLLPPSATSTRGPSPFLNTEQCDELNHRNKPAR